MGLKYLLTQMYYQQKKNTNAIDKGITRIVEGIEEGK